MGMAVKVKMLLAVRGMTLKELGAKLEPPTSVQNINATFMGGFVLNDTGTEIQ